MERLPLWLQWSFLSGVSLILSFVFHYFQLPAASLLGPMITGVIMGFSGVKITINKRVFMLAQSILGCMIAQSLSPAIITTVIANWFVIVIVLLLTLAASSFSGLMLVRFSELPGTTGAWGSSPGGASAMVALADEYGADVRLVAFMQYLRVLLVAAAAAMITIGQSGHIPGATSAPLFTPFLNVDFISTLFVALGGAWLARLSGIPSGTLLLPAILGAALHASGTLSLQIPQWLLMLAYAVIGWSVGLRFNKQIFFLALRSLPQMLLSISCLMLLCGGMAWILTQILHVDLMTAYLATSPGGLDTVAIIAAGSQVDIAFVMALQTLRLFTILLAGPSIARFISRYARS